MLCCVGLIGGMAVGQYLGGPWTVIAPAAGFAIGLVGDMRFMKGFHNRGHQQHDTGPQARRDAGPVGGMEVVESRADQASNPENYIGEPQKAGFAHRPLER